MKKIKSKFPLTIYLLVCLASITKNKQTKRDIPPRHNNENVFEFGQYNDPCLNISLNTQPIANNTLLLSGMTFTPSLGNKPNQVVLSPKYNNNNKQGSSQLYFRNPLNLDNGFVLTFNLDVSYKKYEGFAVVLSKNPFGAKGADGDGLGYVDK